MPSPSWAWVSKWQNGLDSIGSWFNILNFLSFKFTILMKHKRKKREIMLVLLLAFVKCWECRQLKKNLNNMRDTLILLEATMHELKRNLVYNSSWCVLHLENERLDWLSWILTSWTTNMFSLHCGLILHLITWTTCFLSYVFLLSNYLLVFVAYKYAASVQFMKLMKFSLGKSILGVGLVVILY